MTRLNYWSGCRSPIAWHITVLNLVIGNKKIIVNCLLTFVNTTLTFILCLLNIQNKLNKNMLLVGLNMEGMG